MVKEDSAVVNEFLAVAIDELYDEQEKLIKKVRKMKTKHKVYIVATMGVIFYIYNKLDARLKKLENNEEVTINPKK